jgi:hypothetical protein
VVFSRFPSTNSISHSVAALSSASADVECNHIAFSVTYYSVDAAAVTLSIPTHCSFRTVSQGLQTSTIIHFRYPSPYWRQGKLAFAPIFRPRWARFLSFSPAVRRSPTVSSPTGPLPFHPSNRRPHFPVGIALNASDVPKEA